MKRRSFFKEKMQSEKKKKVPKWMKKLGKVKNKKMRDAGHRARTLGGGFLLRDPYSRKEAWVNPSMNQWAPVTIMHQKAASDISSLGSIATDQSFFESMIPSSLTSWFTQSYDYSVEPEPNPKPIVPTPSPTLPPPVSKPDPTPADVIIPMLPESDWKQANRQDAVSGSVPTIPTPVEIPKKVDIPTPSSMVNIPEALQPSSEKTQSLPETPRLQLPAPESQESANPSTDDSKGMMVYQESAVDKITNYVASGMKEAFNTVKRKASEMGEAIANVGEPMKEPKRAYLTGGADPETIQRVISQAPTIVPTIASIAADTAVGTANWAKTKWDDAHEYLTGDKARAETDAQDAAKIHSRRAAIEYLGPMLSHRTMNNDIYRRLVEKEREGFKENPSGTRLMYDMLEVRAKSETNKNPEMLETVLALRRDVDPEFIGPTFDLFK